MLFADGLPRWSEKPIGRVDSKNEVLVLGSASSKCYQYRTEAKHTHQYCIFIACYFSLYCKWFHCFLFFSWTASKNAGLCVYVAFWVILSDCCVLSVSFWSSTYHAIYVFQYYLRDNFSFCILELWENNIIFLLISIIQSFEFF